jgi:hypothetical protein
VVGCAGPGSLRWRRLVVVVAAALAVAVFGGGHSGAALASGGTGWAQLTGGVPIPSTSAADGPRAAAGEACAAAIGARLRPVWAPVPAAPLGWLTTDDRNCTAAARTQDHGGGGAHRRRSIVPDRPGSAGVAGLQPVDQRPDPAAGLRVLGRGPPAARV